GKAVVRRLLDNPVMGFAPWILFSVIEGPGRFDLAAGAACGCGLLILAVGLAVGIRGKLLDLAAIVFFAVLLAIGLAGGHGIHEWLERWAGEISNVMIVLVALGSVVVRRPFTLQYARESTERQYWDSPLFLHINYVLTWVWIGAFAVTAAVGWYGDGPLHEPDNIWTNWIISIALLIFAIRFTEWYPNRAKADALRSAGAPNDVDPGSITVGALFLPLAAYLVPIGIVFLVFDAAPWWIGVSLIVLGGAIGQHLKGAEDEAKRQSGATSPTR
ncbi:MAG: hypothetical protein JO368_05365, partial [Acidimicrobiales bacterium]|nr:hypothetical protein [Acidimicrobiales bacterium]